MPIITQRYYLTKLLSELEAKIKPPEGCHHAIGLVNEPPQLAIYVNDASDWKAIYTYILEDEDFALDVYALVAVTCQMHNNNPLRKLTEATDASDH